MNAAILRPRRHALRGSFLLGVALALGLVLYSRAFVPTT